MSVIITNYEHDLTFCYICETHRIYIFKALMNCRQKHIIMVGNSTQVTVSGCVAKLLQYIVNTVELLLGYLNTFALGL